MKKKICIISIILIALILIDVFLITNKKLSKAEYISLIKKFETVTNVKMEDDVSTQYLKDGVKLSIVNENLYIWVNSNTKEYIGYDPESKYYALGEYIEEDYSDFENASYKFIRI